MTDEEVNAMLVKGRGTTNEKQVRTILKHREDSEQANAEKAAEETKPKADKPKGK